MRCLAIAPLLPAKRALPQPLRNTLGGDKIILTRVLIVHWLSWRDIFFVNVPVGIATLWFGLRHMPDYHGYASTA